jgi:ATP-dependent NAD(P)H-hydrate dehydratase
MSTPPPGMSRATREILAKVRKMIPPMLEKFHKGKYVQKAISVSSGRF